MYTMRNISLSTMYKVFHILHLMGWKAARKGVKLDETKGDGLVNTFGPVIGRPFVFLDDFGDLNASQVNVYVGGQIQDPSKYTVDYLHGRIKFKTRPTGVVTADFTQLTCIVIDAYPSDEFLQAAELPIIAVQFQKQNSTPAAIGQDLDHYRQEILIDILARNEGERQDLTDQIQKLIRRTPLYNFSVTQLFDSNGGLNSGFDRNVQFLENLRHPIRPRSQLLPPRKAGSDKEKWRSFLIIFTQHVG